MNVVDKERQVENDSAIHCTVCTVEDQDKNNLVIQLRYRYADYIRVLNLRGTLHFNINLGSNLDVKYPDFHICKDKPGPKIHFIHDVCHALKLVRNAWHKHKKIKNGDVIDWTYIERLYELQSREHLKCANKLFCAHIFFQNNKTKVKYAAQLLSRSVSLSLKYCRENLKLEQFQGSEATEKFLLIINDIFDLMNSRSEFSNNWYWMICTF